VISPHDVLDPWAPPAWVVTDDEPAGPVGRTGPEVLTDRSTPSRGRRVLSRLATVALVAALLALGFIGYGASVDNRWYKIVAIEGGSMRPTLEVGDAIVITRPPEKVEPGMVLVMQVDKQVVTHRVVEVHPDGTFITKGDANRGRDDFPSDKVRVVGEERARLPLVGRLLTRGG